MRLQFFSCLRLFVLLLPALAGAQWEIVEDITSFDDVVVQYVGPRQQPFPRPPPKSVEASILQEFYDSFNLMQDVQPEGDNMFTFTADQYVALIPQALVEGEGGLIYDSKERVYHLPYFFFNRTSVLQPMPQHTLPEAQQECERYTSLASVVQKYGHMYYHFLEETLPRVVLLQKAGLDEGTKILTWGQPYEYEYFALLGIPRDSIVVYDPSKIYCADTLLVPTPTPRITPPKEALQAVREALGVETLPQDERQLVVYVSRRGEATRQVDNEEQLLGNVQAVFPGEQIVVFNGSMSPQETISLFQQAKLVLGPHGAGLSHSLFCAPGTALVEFLFLVDPPMMFWHTAAALRLEYWLVPVSQAYWMQQSMEVSVDEVIDVLSILLPSPGSSPDLGSAPLACPPGSFYFSGKCSVCPAGTYAFGSASWTCKTCFLGRVSGSDGSSYCKTCLPGTYADPSRRQCADCPSGSFSPLPGAWDKSQCLTPQQRQEQMLNASSSAQQLAKLSPLFARTLQRRALIQGILPAADGQLPAVSEQELCRALVQAGASFDDPYRGPYLLNGTLTNCLAADITSPFPYTLSPGSQQSAPPLDVPSLSPALITALSPKIPELPVSESGTQVSASPPTAAAQGEGQAGNTAWLPTLLGVLGAAIAVAVAGGLAYYLWRRRKGQQQPLVASGGAGGGSGRDYETLACEPASGIEELEVQAEEHKGMGATLIG